MMINLILTDTAIECISRQAHFPHKIPARDALGFPFPIEPVEFIPINRDRLSARVFALCLSDLTALTLSLFELLTLQLREGSEHGEHKLSAWCVGVDVLLMADKGNTLVGESVDDVQQVLCGAP